MEAEIDNDGGYELSGGEKQTIQRSSIGKNAESVIIML